MADSQPPTRDDVLLSPGAFAGRLDPAEVFADSGSGVELEIGCGKGRFLLAAATRWPDRRFLAVEHSRKLVRKVRDKVARAGLTNVRLHHGNARDLVTRLLPEQSLVRVHVYFPDPWPKRRHAKHRLFGDPFPDHVARVLRPGGELLLATDFDAYFREVVARLALHPALVRTTHEEAFADLPRGGFDAIFEERAIPVLRACWQKVQTSTRGPAA